MLKIPNMAHAEFRRVPIRKATITLRYILNTSYDIHSSDPFQLTLFGIVELKSQLQIVALNYENTKMGRSCEVAARRKNPFFYATERNPREIMSKNMCFPSVPTFISHTPSLAPFFTHGLFLQKTLIHSRANHKSCDLFMTAVRKGREGKIAYHA